MVFLIFFFGSQFGLPLRVFVQFFISRSLLSLVIRKSTARYASSAYSILTIMYSEARPVDEKKRDDKRKSKNLNSFDLLLDNTLFSHSLSIRTVSYSDCYSRAVCMNGWVELIYAYTFQCWTL